jgi:hypothetical protein
MLIQQGRHLYGRIGSGAIDLLLMLSQVCLHCLYISLLTILGRLRNLCNYIRGIKPYHADGLALRMHRTRAKISLGLNHHTCIHMASFNTKY